MVLETRTYREVRSTFESDSLHLVRPKPVSNPGFCENVAGSLTRLDFLSQIVHEHPQIFGGLNALPAPTYIQEHSVCQHLAGVTRHVDQKIKFLGRQMNFLPLD